MKSLSPRLIGCLLSLCAFAFLKAEASAQTVSLPPLKVSSNNRFLVQDFGDGKTRPFFWLGDTAWNLHRLQKTDIDLYLEDRAARGYNVIQGPVLDWTGLETGSLSRNNGYGVAAYTNKNTSTPGLNADVSGAEFNDYFDQIDYIINKAESLGMYVVLLPFWAQGINDLDDNTTEQAALREIGRKLGDRYKNRSSVIWFVGGEASGESPDASVRILAEGLEAGHGGANLTAVHATGKATSGSKFHNDAWLDFNMLQSGHNKDFANYNLIAADYARTPTKPTFEAEYYYPDFKRTNDTYRAQAIDARKGAYWSLFAGGFGYTYGHDAIWQYWKGGSDAKYPSTSPTVDWKTALAEESGSQMIHVRRLMESRPFLSRIPHQGLIINGLGGTTDGSADHVQATRDGTPGNKNATYIMVYTPVAKSLTIDTSFIASNLIDAWWFNPRTGEATRFFTSVANPLSLTVTTPAASGLDWVLVVDDATQGYREPGAPERPRLIVTTDIGGDPDDEQSMVRLLTYANEFDMEGLIASASGTPGELGQDIIKPQLIVDRVNVYGQVRANLLKHKAGFPTQQQLLDVIKNGNPNRGTPNESRDTDGSNWIISVVDRPDPRPVWIAIWGGCTDVAQAFWRVQNDPNRTAAQKAAFVAKVRLYAISDQDGIGAWIKTNVPALRYLESTGGTNSGSGGGLFRGMYQNDSDSTHRLVPEALTPLVWSNEWVTPNVTTNHGPLGALYPGTVDQNPKGGFNKTGVKEGDTPSWFYLLSGAIGLSNLEDPVGGGWGGRFKKVTGTVDRWVDAEDAHWASNADAAVRRKWTVARWREAYQNDFAARMDWNVATSFSAANHNPIAAFENDTTRNPVYLTAVSGTTVNLNAAGSMDPDNHTLSYAWFQYREAGTFAGSIAISNSTASAASFVAPSVTAPQTIHTILAVTDNGTPSLTSYRRIIVTVNPAPDGNIAPAVSIASPANNATFTAPANITITANATDSDGTISKVEFFQGSTKLGEDTSGGDGWSYPWNNVSTGSYSLTARATDNAGAVTTSSPVVISVQSANTPPVVSISSPSNNATFTAPANITITANATDSDGTISKVEFFQGSTKLGEDTSGSDGWSYSWNSVAAGSYSLTARATDNGGATSTSSTVNISVSSGSGGNDVTSNQLGRWKFDEASGTSTSDSSGNGNHGSLVNSPAWAAGRTGAALQFNGSSNYVEIPSSSTMNQTGAALTLSAWVYKTANQANWRMLIHRQAGTSTGDQWALAFNGDKAVLAVNTGTLATVTAPTATPVNQWVHVAGTWDGSTMRLYINGSQVATTARSGTITVESKTVTIGAGRNGTAMDEFFAGRINEARIYSRALSASEVQQVYLSVNQTPVVNAGADQTIALPSTASLSGSASDDGFPSPLTTAWSKVSGPGTVSFGNGSAAATTATFSLPGNYTLRLTASDGTASSSDDVVITVNDSAEGWRARWFSDLSPSDPRIADGADFDGDGIANLMEYAFGLNPRQNDASAQPLVAEENGYLTMTYFRNKTATDLTYLPEATSDLNGVWQSGDAVFTQTIVSEDETMQTIRVTDKTPAASVTQRFLRLKVLRP
jgi:hypothetical protein